MKALVTGATGFIGSHTADMLLEKGFDVHCTIRKTSNLRWLKDKPFKLHEASFSEIESLKKAAEGADYIFHVAGATFARNFEDFLRSNRDGTKNLLEAAKQTAPDLKRFLFISSQTVAGPSQSLEKPKVETDACFPITSYGKSKKAAEDEVLKYKDIMPVTIVRPPAVIGPRDTAIFPLFKAVKGGLATLIGIKPKYLSLIHSHDVARGAIEAALSDNTKGKIYFLSSEKFYTWDEIMDMIKNSVGRKKVFKLKIPHFIVLSAGGMTEFLGKLSTKPPIFNYEKAQDFIQQYWTCSVEAAKNDFGYRQMMPMEQAIEDTVKWYIDNKWM